MVPSTVVIPLECAFLLTTSGTSKSRVAEPLAFAPSGCRKSRALKRKTDGPLSPSLRFFIIQDRNGFLSVVATISRRLEDSACEEVADQACDFGRMSLEREVARIEEMNLRTGNVASERLGTCW